MGIKISMQREVKERIRKEIIEAAEQFAEEYEIENYTDTASALNCVYAEFKNQFDWKIKQIGEYNAFIEWLKGLPMQFDYSYFDMRERIKYWFNQSNEEASKYSDEQVDKLYWNLLSREFFALVKKFNVSGIPEPQSESTKPYDMDDYIDNDNALEESTALVSDYNGWTNYDTWNVMLWINNDYGIYKEAVHFMNKYFKNDPYKDFIIYCGLENDKTPDKVEWISDKLNYNELNDAMREFVESTAEEELIEEEDLDFLRKYD